MLRAPPELKEQWDAEFKMIDASVLTSIIDNPENQLAGGHFVDGDEGPHLCFESFLDVLEKVKSQYRRTFVKLRTTM